MTNALPRAILYTRWNSLPDKSALRQQLTDPAFNPQQTVLLFGSETPTMPRPSTGQPITPEVTLYSPHRIDIKLPPQPTKTVLLLNDRYDKNWIAMVDGVPVKILRGNYLMRAVAIPPGSREASFIYAPDRRRLFLSLSFLLLLMLASISRLFFRQKVRP
jgi:hypothetical protein